MTTQTTIDISDMLEMIELLRKEKYPDLQSELVLEIVRLEDKFIDNRSEVKNRIEKSVDAICQQGGNL